MARTYTLHHAICPKCAIQAHLQTVTTRNDHSRNGLSQAKGVSWHCASWHNIHRSCIEEFLKLKNFMRLYVNLLLTKTDYRMKDTKNIFAYSVLYKTNDRESKLKFIGMNIKYFECLQRFTLKGQLQKSINISASELVSFLYRIISGHWSPYLHDDI